MAEANRGLAWRVAGRFHRPGSGEDARQELGAIALLALCEAAQGFDASLGYTFGTYATQACVQAILDVRRSEGLIHTPRYLSHASHAGHRYQVHREHVRDAKYADAGLAGLAATAPGPVLQAEAGELRDTIRRLPWRQFYVLERKAEGWTNAEIGRAMGCTKQYIHDLFYVARARLRKRLNDK